MTTSIEPLRKVKDDAPYTRPPEVTAAIERSFTWTFDELVENAAITDRWNSSYVPSEVLMHRLRGTKKDNSDRRFLALYDIAMKRLEAACPRVVTSEGKTEFENAKFADIRDRLVAHVVDLILGDRQDYEERLDIFEVRFDRAIRYLRIDKFRRVARHEEGKAPLEYDDGSGEIVHEVEDALGRFQQTISSPEEALTYRISLRRAIDALPDQERKVIELTLAGIPIENNDPIEPSIVKLLSIVEKTARNRKKSAVQKIIAALHLEGGNER